MTEPLDLDALAALEQAATPGPWQALASEVIDDGGHVAWTAASPEPIADAALIAALRNAAPGLLEELAHLRRWKAEALPVMAGLQELGRALDVPLGKSITARESVDMALDLRNRAAIAEAAVVDLQAALRLATGDARD